MTVWLLLLLLLFLLLMFLYNIKPIIILHNKKQLEKVDVFKLASREHDLKDLLTLLKVVAVYSRVLEGAYITLPHVPYVVHSLLDKLSQAVDGETNQVRHLRNTLWNSVKTRLGKHLTDGTQPTVQAATLMPCYMNRLAAIGIADGVAAIATSKVVEWLDSILLHRSSCPATCNMVFSKHQSTSMSHC